MNTILEKVKVALRITTDDFDNDIKDLINACLLDLGIAGVTAEVPQTGSIDELILQAIKTYCKMNFGDASKVEQYDRLKASYDEQKAQMQMATGYTVWVYE